MAENLVSGPLVTVSVAGLGAQVPDQFATWVDRGILRLQTGVNSWDPTLVWPLENPAVGIAVGGYGSNPIVRFLGGWPQGQIAYALQRILEFITYGRLQLSPLTQADLGKLIHPVEVTLMTTPG
ncbi:MAG: hypothetical protein M1499_01965 [Firmicutes bacterium]|nr:hypothetical protein [Bacillota bacterium]